MAWYERERERDVDMEAVSQYIMEATVGASIYI